MLIEIPADATCGTCQWGRDMYDYPLGDTCSEGDCRAKAPTMVEKGATPVHENNAHGRVTTWPIVLDRQPACGDWMPRPAKPGSGIVDLSPPEEG